jgi:hypothetical protein
VLRSQSRNPPRPSPDYFKALAQRDTSIAAWDSFFDQWDVLLCAPCMTSAFPHCEPGSPLAVDGAPIDYWTVGAHTTAFNYSGNPAAVLPCGLDRSQLPIGVQLVGKRWTDSRLLGIARVVSGSPAAFNRRRSRWDESSSRSGARLRRQRRIDALVASEPQRTIERHARERRAKLERAESFAARSLEARLEQHSCEATTRTRRMHEERADTRSVDARIEQWVGPDLCRSPPYNVRRRLHPPDATISPSSSMTKYVRSAMSCVSAPNTNRSPLSICSRL